MTKEDFIAKYLDKKMKNHKLPYGMEYFNRVATMEDKAGKLWGRLKNQNFKPKNEWLCGKGQNIA